MSGRNAILEPSENISADMDRRRGGSTSIRPACTTKRVHREKIGRQYASELQRRFDRVSAYQPID